MRLLVGYASAKGSTRGVAERIGADLDAAGYSVDVREIAEISDVGAYGAVVLGSAIHGGQWLPEASAAIEHLISHLERKPVWAFSVSSVGATSTIISTWLARLLRRVTPEPRTVQSLRGAADVRDHRFFAGSIAPGGWSGFGGVVFRLMGGHYGDGRDWGDIDRWAAAIGTEVDRGTPR